MTQSVSNKNSPVAITGIGCLFPKASDTSMFWANIVSGIDCLTEIPETHWSLKDYFDPDPAKPDHTHARTGGFLDPVSFDPMEFGIAPNALEATDTSQLLTLLAAKQALKDAGYTNGAALDRDRVSIILGVTGAQQLVITLGARLYHPLMRKTLIECGLTESEADQITQRINHKLVGWQEASFPGLLGNVVAGRIANRFDFGGMNCVVDAACAGSLASVHTAMMELQTQKADMVITGGVDTFNDIFMYMCFSKTKAMSPTGHARPFDAAADGTAIGEGVGVVTLKRLTDAERDGDTIYAVIRGTGASSDGKGNAIYAPSASGQKKALKRAYQESDVSPDTIQLVEAHGTGTPVGDAIELEALTDVYREAKSDGKWCAVGSVKAQIGHGKAAAGIAGLIKTALALHHRVIPPVAKVSTPTKTLANGLSPFYLPTLARPWLTPDNHPRRAAVSSFGFGGSNFHCVLEEHTGTPSPPDWDGSVQIVAFSADNTSALLDSIKNISIPEDNLDLRAVAKETRDTFKSDHRHRWLMVVTSANQLADMLKMALSRISATPDTSWDTPDGMFYGVGNIPGKLAAVFPGQGNQYPDMLRDTACRFPVFREILENADRAFAENAPESDTNRLSKIIYPLSTFNDKQRNEQIETLKQTQYAQPGIGAVSIGAWQVLTHHFGLSVDAAAGHSYGEICAMYAAGMISLDEFNYLSSLRGRLMSNGDEDRGGMAAVQASAEDISVVLKDEQLDLVIANKNAPNQSVISGATKEIARAVDCFRKRNFTITPLKVSAAFHSPLVADASKPFGQYLDRITFQKPLFPVYSNTTGVTYPSQQKKIREILASQLEKPVEFVSEIQQMVADGVRTFVEIGPGKRMAGLIRAILDDTSVRLISLDASSGKRSGQIDLARTIAALASLGYSISVNEWDQEYVPSTDHAGSKMQVTLTGSNYVRQKSSLPEFKIQREIGQPEEKHSSVMSKDNRSVPASKAFESIQKNLEGLQQLQEQTALLHQKFLTGQMEAQQAFQNLIAQQQHVLTGTPPVQQSVTHVSSVRSQPSETVELKTTDMKQEDIETDKPDYSEMVLTIVSEKTGYPSELLEPEMELDADLGIDSIKRVEIMSAVQEQLQETGPIAPDQMASIRTLRDVIHLLNNLVPASSGKSVSKTHHTVAQGKAPAESSATPGHTDGEPPRITDESVLDIVCKVVSDKTGYPTDLLEPNMELDADLGIDSIKRVEIMSALQEELPEITQIAPDQMSSIHTLNDIAALINASDMSAPEISEKSILQKTSTESPEVESAKPSSGKASPFDTQPIQIKQDVTSDSIVETVRGIIADKTGYPSDLLEPDMELDADLGIDSIKRVEIMSALQETIPGLPGIKPEQLAELRSIGNIENLVTALKGTLGKQTMKADQLEPPVEPAPSPAVVNTESEPKVSESVPDKLYRMDRKILTLQPLNETNRNKIVLPEHAEIWITRDDCGLSELLLEALENMYIPVRIISLDYLEFVELPDDVAGLILVGPRDSCDMEYLQKLFKLVKLVSKKVRNPSRSDKSTPAIISLLRLDGALGLHDTLTDYRPMTAALSGLVKTIRQEWPEVYCRIIDVDADRKYEPDLNDLIEEMFREGPLETGFSSRGKVQVVMQDEPIDPKRLTREPLVEGDWLLATGGARGVTAACVIEIARRFRTNFVLAGRSQPPEPEPEWLAGISDDAEIKKAIMEQANKKLTPKELQTEYLRYMNNREIYNTVKTLKTIGVQVQYEQVDLTDSVQVSTLTKRMDQSGFTLAGLIHGAGIIADNLIDNKSEDDFCKVVNTKVESLRCLAENLTLETMKTIILFSSSTARFGRTGQVDYAMANEVLNKFAAKVAKMYPMCRTMSINWGPWDGGMVTPELKELFRKENVEVIDIRSGARHLIRELCLEHTPEKPAPAEIVVMGTTEPDTDLPQDLRPELTENNLVDKTGPEAGPTDIKWREVFNLVLSPDSVPVLKHHLINKRPVVPMALLMEWCASCALEIHSDLNFLAFDDFRLLKGIILSEKTPLELEAKAGVFKQDSNTIYVPVELRGIQSDGKKYVHVSTDVMLSKQFLEPVKPPLPFETMEPCPVQRNQLYQDVLFHGKMLQGVRSVEGMSQKGIHGVADGSPEPAKWLKRPLRKQWITDPGIIDAAFQLVILWTTLNLDMPSLPCGLKRYTQFVKKMPSRANVDIRIKNRQSAQIISDVYFSDPSGKIIACIEGLECIADKGLKEAFRAHRKE